MANKPPPPTTLLLLLLLLSTTVHGRLITTHSSPSNIISDGVHDHLQDPKPFLLRFSTSESCEQTYGFMPCTTVIGNLFLIVVYGYLMFLAARCLFTGSQLMLKILGPGVIGGLLLPILSAFPEAMLIFVSGLSGTTEIAQSKVSVGMGLLSGSTIMLLTIIWGSCVVAGKCDLRHSLAVDKQDTKGFSLTASGLSGSTETAQYQVSVGMGLLAGSTITLLTIIWGSCVVVGKCDLQDSLAIDTQDTKRFSLTGSGVSTDIWTSYTTRILAISIIPFIIVQIPQVLHSTSGRNLAVLISLIVSLLLLISYFLYQVSHPWIQKRQLPYAKHKHVISGILKHLKKCALGRLLTDDGEPNKEVIKKLFSTIDENQDGNLSVSKLKALIIGIQFENIDLDKNDAVGKVMVDFDTSNNDLIDEEEFVKGISKWLNEVKHSGASREAGPCTEKILSYYHQQTKREHVLLGDPILGGQSDFHLQTKREHDLLGGQSDEVIEGKVNPRWTLFEAVLMLLLGTIIAVVFADPLVDAIDNFSSATSIPSFFVSFIALPLATNTTEAVSAIIHASKKKLRTASLTFSAIYGVVTMNNLLCLSVFSALVYIRGLTWDFSAEVLVIVIVCIAMGVFASFRTTFPLWTSSVAFLLYPFSLALIYVLNYGFGWS